MEFAKKFMAEKAGKLNGKAVKLISALFKPSKR